MAKGAGGAGRTSGRARGFSVLRSIMPAQNFADLELDSKYGLLGAINIPYSAEAITLLYKDEHASSWR